MEISYPKNTCACFTGHRIMTEGQTQESAKKLFETIEKLYKQGVVNFYAGGALGFDLTASVTLLNMKRTFPDLTLNLALPCKNYNKKWSNAQIQLFERVKGRSDSIFYVNDEYSLSCMQQRNKYMVDRSSFCIAYLTQEKGGTFNTVKYAKRMGVPVINLAEESCQLKFDF